MQEWLLEVWETLHKTVIYVTHDIDEAIFLSDRVYAMSARPGRIIEQVRVDPPRPCSHEVRTSEAFLDHKVRLAERSGRGGAGSSIGRDRSEPAVFRLELVGDDRAHVHRGLQHVVLGHQVAEPLPDGDPCSRVASR